MIIEIIHFNSLATHCCRNSTKLCIMLWEVILVSLVLGITMSILPSSSQHISTSMKNFTRGSKSSDSVIKFIGNPRDLGITRKASRKFNLRKRRAILKRSSLCLNAHGRSDMEWNALVLAMIQQTLSKLFYCYHDVSVLT